MKNTIENMSFLIKRIFKYHKIIFSPSMMSSSSDSKWKKLGKIDPKHITDDEWRSVLTDEEYEISRCSGTERAFTGKYDTFFKPGKYVCVCCGANLFLSDHKFNSGCGWPAFSKSFNQDENIKRLSDNSIPGRPRTEVRCSKCNAHLGHVFDDGPQDQGGERYCINSVSMDFVPAENK